MKEKLELSEILPIIAPLIVIQLVLMIIALVLCIKAERTRGPKVMWILIIIFGNILGPVAYFIFGRSHDE